MADEQTTTTENGTPAPEVKDDLKAQLKAEQEARDKLIAEATQPLQERIAKLEEALKGKDEQITTHTTQAQALNEKLSHAVNAYKELVLVANPLLPKDMITGSTIEELTASVQKASALVDAVRTSLGAIQEQTRIPAGAPPRKEPDISSMSTVEKINYGLEQAKKKK